MQVNYFTFKAEDFVCPNCGWHGKGAELSNGNFSEENSICDLVCPSCSEHIGFWQAPTKAEVEKWKRENPDGKTGWEDTNNR